MATYAQMQAELEWLKKHPWFVEKPASVLEFLGPEYLNIEKGIRPGVKEELIKLFGEEVNGLRIAKYRYGMFTGAIGIGKTTMASIVLPYMCHWIMCLRNPQEFYNLLPGTKIAFMQMSTSEDQAVETVFGDIKSRVEYSPWFQQNYPFDPKFTKQIRFPQKNIWILPGNSSETTFEGYNILGGILDEADSHKVTKDKDYADQGFNTIDQRIDSRFQDRGFLLVVGQMKKASGFAKRKYDEMNKDPSAHTVRMTIWESMGRDFDRYQDENGNYDSFWYDIQRKEVVPSLVALRIKEDNKNLLEIPTFYRFRFENAPEKALRDLAGIPPAAGDPFISLTYKLEEAVERWQKRYDNIGSPVDADSTRPRFAKWFKSPDSLRRAMHLDIAYSAEGDALGLAMGHISEMIEDDGDLKPYIVFDFLLRMKAAPGTEIMLSEVRRVIYDMKEEHKFRIRMVTMDGFQSTEMKQQLRKRKFITDYLSVDRSKLSYEDLRDAINENRVEFPPYMTYLNRGDSEKVEIAYKELSELEDGDKKVDHPSGGSKDVADCMAGVVSTLMGDRTYRRNVASPNRSERQATLANPSAEGYEVGRLYIPGTGPGGLHAPIPQILAPGSDSPFMPIPTSLRPRRD